MAEYRDYVVRATAAGGQIRAFAATTRDLVEEARKAHNMSPVATTALGRLLAGGAMMGQMLKNKDDLLTITINCDGPINGMTVVSDVSGRTKGYVNNPDVMLPVNEQGRIDVAKAMGLGVINVIKDIGLREPYVGQTILVTSEIAEDLTYYFASSEQVPSSVALGVLMSKDNTVSQAGGFIIQLMPGASDEIIDELEKKINSLTSITTMLEQGMTPEDILNYVLGDFELTFYGQTSVEFYCNCSKERVGKALMSVGKKDLQEMIDDGKTIEVNCHFCNKNYYFTVDELKEMLM